MTDNFLELIAQCGDNFGDLELMGGKDSNNKRIWTDPSTQWRVSTFKYGEGIKFFSGATPQEAVKKLLNYLNG